MDLRLPQLGEGADSGVVVNVFVKAGDTLALDQPVIEMENEKAIATVPSTISGVIAKVHVKPGDKLAVGQRILSVTGAAGESDQAPASETDRAREEATPERDMPAKTPGLAATAPPEEGETGHAEPPDTPGVEPAAAPSLRRLAKQLGIDLRKVRGGARGGRIVMDDLKAYIGRLERIVAQAKTGPPRAVTAPAAEPIDFSKWGPITIRPLSPLRQVISRRLSQSWPSIPQVTQFDEADVTRLLALRKQHAPAYQQKGVRLTLTGFVLKALASMLQRHPTFNASLDETGQNLIIKAYCHIGIAVDTEAGLIVPVLRNADRKTLLEVSRELEDLAQKARDRKVSAEDLKGASFTVSNQGGIGGGHFTPVVNKPEVAILGLGRGAVKVAWKDGRAEPRTMLPLALSYDHRVIDGANAARFIVDLVQAIENFEESQVEI